jgi:hypothetical protein
MSTNPKRRNGLRPSDIDIPEDEQRRLIKAFSPIHHSVESTGPVEDIELGDEIFNALILIIPFTSLYLIMDMSVSVNSPKSGFKIST